MTDFVFWYKCQAPSAAAEVCFETVAPAPGLDTMCPNQPIRDQYPGHVINFDKSENQISYRAGRIQDIFATPDQCSVFVQIGTI